MKNFPLAAAIGEGLLVPVAIGLGWPLKTPPLATLRLDTQGVLLGVAATVPVLGVFWFCLKCPWRPMADIAKIVDEMISAWFRDCPLVQLAILSTLAGLGEEMLFRGVVQAAAMTEIGGPAGVAVGLVVSAFLFGMLHALTPAYAVMAGLIGLYLGGLWLLCGNLLAPVVAHGLYDFLVLAYLVKRKRAS
jgi:uncharacterized protein